MRPLDRPDDRHQCVLEVLVQAGYALRRSDIEEALSQIATSLVATFCEYCSIAVAVNGVERFEFSVERGALGPRAAGAATIVEPLSDGRSTLGKITCRRASQEFDDVIRQAIRLLAIQLSVALAHQIAIQREHRVADRLQRALLPEHLPVLDGSEFFAAYRPASAEAEVGGDWFDAFVLPGERIGISVGDVAGHGLEAAVIMGEVRQAIRASAIGTSSPAEVLERANRIVALNDSVGMVTAIFGYYVPATSRLVYAVAGHPPPLLVLPRTVRRLPSGGLPLGCAPAIGTSDWTFTLPADAALLFYTDGMIENERDPIAGERRLCEVARSLLGENAPPCADPATAMQDGVFGDAANRDDAAVLLLRRSMPVKSYVFSAVPVVAPIARSIVEREIRDLDIEPQRRFDLVIAVGEAVANAVEHAYRDAPPGLVQLRIDRDARQLIATIEDFGHWRPFARSEERGRGIELMHACMDSVQIRSTRGSTQILLKAQLAS